MPIMVTWEPFMPSKQSVTQWLFRCKEGDEEAAQRLWERFFGKLVRLARIKLKGTKRTAADEEDVALSALDSFFRRAAADRFPDLHDRESLWPLLVKITARKAIKLAQHERRRKRGGGAVRGDSALTSPQKHSNDAAGWDRILGHEPNPAIAAEISEELRRLLEKLDDATLYQIALWKMEEFTSAEIAAKLGRSERTIERKLRRIRCIWEEEIA
jgi:DNA-directed RNA polymerase specialized sigma24 family protein